MCGSTADGMARREVVAGGYLVAACRPAHVVFDAVASTTCGWCGRFSNMTQGPKTTEVREDERRTLMATFTCNHCSRLTLGWINTHKPPATSSITSDALLASVAQRYPNDVNWLPRYVDSRSFSDVPDHIGSAASEAFECRWPATLHSAST